MEFKVKIIIDRLTEDSVSILTQKFLVDGDTEEQVGENHRKAYSIEEVKDLREEVPEPYLTAVLTAWGENVEEEQNDTN